MGGCGCGHVTDRSDLGNNCQQYHVSKAILTFNFRTLFMVKCALSKFVLLHALSSSI